MTPFEFLIFLIDWSLSGMKTVLKLLVPVVSLPIQFVLFVFLAAVWLLILAVNSLYYSGFKKNL
jgi:hypothetical protein